MTPKIKNLLYGWRAREDGLTTFMLGDWYANDPPGGTAVRVHLIPPKNLLREDDLVFNQYEAIVYLHGKVIMPLKDVGAFTDIVFEKKRVTLSFIKAGTRIAHLKDAAEALDVRPYKLESVEVLPQGARYRWDDLYSTVRAWGDDEMGDVDRAVKRALKNKKLRSPGSFEKRAGLDRPRLDPKKLMEGLAWLDKALQRFPVPDIGFYLNVHPVQSYVNFEAMNPERTTGYWLNESVNEALGEFFGFDINDARRMCAVLYKAKIWSAPELSRIELTEEH